MISKSQKWAVAISLVASIYLLIFVIPSKVPQAPVKPKPTEQLAENDKIVLLPFPADPAPLPAEDESDPFGETGIADPQLRANDEFTRRFGIPYQDAFSPKPAFRHEFTVPPALEATVNFWVQVFGKYQRYQYLFHDRDEPGRVYSVLDLTHLDPSRSGLDSGALEKTKQDYFDAERSRIQRSLKYLSEKIARRVPLNPEETRWAQLFAGADNSEIIKAADTDRIRIQSGFASRFKEAIRLSGQYMAEMENIFSMKGVPVEITRLPIIESAFNIEAYSTAAAAGIWQFIPETGRRYLKIDSIADERRDPILATYAAAEHLKGEYELVGSWPLAINAYNTGPGRILKAKKQLGTSDIATIIRHFKDPGYQFYSRNYYPEFLAALHVYENQERYFGGPVTTLPPLQYEFFVPERPVNLRELATASEISPELMRALNPAFSAPIQQGASPLPSGYIVRVPKNFGTRVAVAAATLNRQTAEAKWHLVTAGQTIGDIAKLYGVPVEELAKENGTLPRTKLSPGMILNLPRGTGVALNPETDRDRL